VWVRALICEVFSSLREKQSIIKGRAGASGLSVLVKRLVAALRLHTQMEISCVQTEQHFLTFQPVHPKLFNFVQVF